MNADSHALFEDIPCLGVMGDRLMRLCVPGDDRQSNFRVTFPENATASRNLCGNLRRRSEHDHIVCGRLNSYGIYHDRFGETVTSTRLNMHLIQRVSTLHLSVTNFRSEPLDILKLQVNGTPAMTITTEVIRGSDRTWTSADVKAYSSSQHPAL